MTKFVFWKCLICSYFILIWVTVWRILDSMKKHGFLGQRMQVGWSVQILGLLGDCLTFHLLPISHKESESVGCSVVSNSLQPHGLNPTRLLCPWNSPGKNTGVGCHSLLQGIFPTQGSNPGLLHRSCILYSQRWRSSIQSAKNKIGSWMWLTSWIPFAKFRLNWRK